jgi:hypothetical protein
MRRFSLTALVVLLTACSYSSTLAIWNRSANAIQITYQLRYPIDSGSQYLPAVAERAKGPWRELEPSAYTLSQDRRVITVTIPAGHALRVARPTNYSGPSLDEVGSFPIIEATLVAGGKTVSFSGERALLAFKEWNDRLFVYTFTGA